MEQRDTKRTASDLAKLARCERQVIYDAGRGELRSAEWERRAEAGTATHEAMEAAVRRRAEPTSEPTQKKGNRMGLILLILGLALIAFAALSRASGSENTEPTEEARKERGRLLPPEISSEAELFAAERTFRRLRPVHVSGRPDDVWLVRGELVPIDTKRRRGSRVYESDVAQLGTYAYLLRDERNGGGHPVASHGYLRFVGHGEPTFRRVELLTDDDVAELHDRYGAVLNGEATPRPSKTAAVCRGCGHRQVCPQSKVG